MSRSAGAHQEVQHDQPAQPDGDRRRVLVDHPESKTITQSPPRSSARTQCATASPPVSSSPSTSTRTLTGSAPACGLRARDVQQRQEVALVVGRAARVDAPVAHVGLERAASSTPPGRRRTARRSGRR
jgi:hypothetical protein